MATTQEKLEQYLKTIDQVIEKGRFKDNWASLSQYKVPQWYKDAKFGIFIHWGVYSVPAFGNEWYPRQMYLEGTKEFEHHVKTYGKHKDFGYKDFIPMFKAEKFDAHAWMQLFKEAGAKYVMPVAEHHDGFQMYDSDLSEFCAKKMGPKRDVLLELEQEAEKQDIVFCASSHRAENYFFFGGAGAFDSGLRADVYEEPYGYKDSGYQKMMPHSGDDITFAPPPKAHLEDWLVRTCEIVDKYRPKIVWFDWTIEKAAFKPYLKKFAAYYYNRADEWGEEVAINYKLDAYAYETAVFDVERGQLSGIRPQLWQTDTATAKNSWGYTENNEFKDPTDILCDMIDIVSKNGCLLLNVGPKADGTITKEDADILRHIGAWLKVNGESIYGTSFFKVFGEGPTKIEEGGFTDTKRASFCEEDIRFTYKAPYVYAHALKYPENNTIKIQSLGKGQFNAIIEQVEVLGYKSAVSFEHTKEALIIHTEGIVSKDPVTFKIKFN